MYKDFEVLALEADYQNDKVRILGEKEHFDKAPYEFQLAQDGQLCLERFFSRRKIPSPRGDYGKILSATGSRNGLELSLKGHGLSLSDHYWCKRDGENLRYADINFFANKWDDAFGRAILRGDYETLRTCDLNVPDVTTAGWGKKGWLWDAGPKLYKRGLDSDHPEEAICEVLASIIAGRILPEGEVLRYDLESIGGTYASVCSCLIGANEELVPLSSILPSELNGLYTDKSLNKALNRDFFEGLTRIGRAEWTAFFVKVACLRSLCFISDLHFGNLSAIKNMDTGELHLAPIHDFGGAFGSSARGRKTLSHPNKATLLLIYFLFGDLDPRWDYSWYDPSRLDGAEKEIREYLSKTEFYGPELIDCAIEIFNQQKKALDAMKRS